MNDIDVQIIALRQQACLTARIITGDPCTGLTVHDIDRDRPRTTHSAGTTASNACCIDCACLACADRDRASACNVLSHGQDQLSLGFAEHEVQRETGPDPGIRPDTSSSCKGPCRARLCGYQAKARHCGGRSGQFQPRAYDVVTGQRQGNIIRIQRDTCAAGQMRCHISDRTIARGTDAGLRLIHRIFLCRTTRKRVN